MLGNACCCSIQRLGHRLLSNTLKTDNLQAYKVHVSVHLKNCHTVKMYGGVAVRLLSILISVLEYGKWSVHATAALPSSIHRTGEEVNRFSSWTLWRRFLTPAGAENRSLRGPHCSQSLYRLRYADSTCVYVQTRSCALYFADTCNLFSSPSARNRTSRHKTGDKMIRLTGQKNQVPYTNVPDIYTQTLTII